MIDLPLWFDSCRVNDRRLEPSRQAFSLAHVPRARRPLMRRSLIHTVILFALLLINSSAQAGVISFSGWVTRNVLGPNPGEKARISEGILFDSAAGTAGAPTYDYIFY